ncbi:MAG: amidohydrolase [Sutterellaceae bacterium]|nr:amidohydrolase [Sutterellaceae bacterium]MDD7442241.1 amidohydrolase [Sutterellaceae bacterium]MDY2868614.1 amidohydrolase [Mesosutterella sp.]
MEEKKLEAEIAPYVISMRRFFHENPELSGHEARTAERIRKELTEAGIPWKPSGKKLGTGTVATIEGGAPGKTVMIRADIDALPIEEKSGVPFASRTHGVMHACGHDCHAAMLLGAARILWQERSSLRGTVKLLFQPAEETAEGALDVIADGALEGVDAIFGMHVGSSIPSGRATVHSGPKSAATDWFRVKFTGESGHAAKPEECIDVAPAVATFVLDLQTIRSRETDPFEPVVVTVGTIRSGSRWNVTSGEAVVEGTIRCYSPEVRERAEKSVERIAKETASAYRCSAETEVKRLCDPVINDPVVTDIAKKAIQSVLGADALYPETRNMAGEDFGFYSTRIPAAFVPIGVGNEACGAIYPQHSDHFRVDEGMLVKGAMIHAAVARLFLNGSL